VIIFKSVFTESARQLIFYHASVCNACRARYCYGKSVRPSVRPSVQRRYCV